MKRYVIVARATFITGSARGSQTVYEAAANTGGRPAAFLKGDHP